MKRSQRVIVPQMHKRMRPVTKGVTAVAAIVLVSGCSDNSQEMGIYSNVSDCIDDNPEYSTQCTSAYQDALDDASKTAPKYNLRTDCEYEFGYDNCIQAPKHSWFMPAMAGFMFGQAMNNRSYFQQPMFSSTYPGSRYYGGWTSSDGYSYGKKSERSKVYVPTEQLKQKPAVTKTISRGGFGSKAAAKSSWSRSGSKSWGG